MMQKRSDAGSVLISAPRTVSKDTIKPSRRGRDVMPIGIPVREAGIANGENHPPNEVRKKWRGAAFDCSTPPASHAG
jgi:hypothetical protein